MQISQEKRVNNMIFYLSSFRKLTVFAQTYYSFNSANRVFKKNLISLIIDQLKYIKLIKRKCEKYEIILESN